MNALRPDLVEESEEPVDREVEPSRPTACSAYRGFVPSADRNDELAEMAAFKKRLNRWWPDPERRWMGLAVYAVAAAGVLALCLELRVALMIVFPFAVIAAAKLTERSGWSARRGGRR